MTTASKPPFVSIVIPAWNEERYIGTTLDAVSRLEYPGDRVEVIVVDNGSTDNTVGVAREFGAKVLQAEGTISSVRNCGAKESSGEILAFLDADSVPAGDWLKRGMDILEDEETSAAGFALAGPSPTASWIERHWHLLSSGSKYRGTVQVQWLSSFNFLVKKEYFNRVGGFNEELRTCEDADLGQRLAAISKLVFSDETTVVHLDTANSALSLFKKELWRGKGNLRAFVGKKITISGIVSTFVPAVFVVLLACCMLSLFYSTGLFVTLFAGALLVPAAMVLYRVRRPALSAFFPMWAVSAIYLAARGIALFRMSQ